MGGVWQGVRKLYLVSARGKGPFLFSDPDEQANDVLLLCADLCTGPRKTRLVESGSRDATGERDRAIPQKTFYARK